MRLGRKSDASKGIVIVARPPAAILNNQYRARLESTDMETWSILLLLASESALLPVPSQAPWLANSFEEEDKPSCIIAIPESIIHSVVFPPSRYTSVRELYPYLEYQLPDHLDDAQQRKYQASCRRVTAPRFARCS